jgi:hypothetical protein
MLQLEKKWIPLCFFSNPRSRAGVTHEYPETAHLDNVTHWKMGPQEAEIGKEAPQETFLER